MAGEEDVELRDLVAQTLEAKGVLGKIRVSSLNYIDCNGPFRVHIVYYTILEGRLFTLDYFDIFEGRHYVNSMIFVYHRLSFVLVYF